MKTFSFPLRRARGNVLLVTIVVAGVVGLVLAAFLSLIRSQNVFVARSQAWNSAMAMVESGIEEAMVHLNKNGVTNITSDGWIPTGASAYAKRRQLGQSYYIVSIFTTNKTRPTIVSSGYEPAPLAGAGQIVTNLPAELNLPANQKFIGRTVRVNTRLDPLFIKAMAAKDAIDLGGNKCTVDSYNSANGAYNKATRGDKGDVSTNSDLIGAVGVGNADIWGKLSTGPKATAKLGPNGSVGSVKWHTAGKTGAEPGWLKRDMNVYFEDVEAPWTGGALTPFPGTNNGVAYTYLMDGGDYQLNSLNLGSGNKIYVSSDTTLFVTGNVNVSGDIKVATNATLRLYIAGSSAILSGTYDKSDIPAQFIVYGLPSCTSIDVKGIAAVIYAPSAKLNLNGDSQFYGASVSKSVRMNGTTDYHYDEALTNFKSRGFVIASWTEI